MSNELDVLKSFSAEDLKAIGDLGQKDGIVQAPKIPVLKINYDDESDFSKGVWVVGQVKKNGAIVEQGQEVDALVILKVKNQYNYFDNDESKAVCKSKLHDDFENVTGNKYKNTCGKKCPYKIEGHCKMQKVVFGIAITKDKKKVQCVSYFKGKSFMPFKNYTDDLCKVKVGDKEVIFPVYSFINKLETRKEQNSTGQKYFVPVFKRADIFKKEVILKMAEDAKALEKSMDSFDHQKDDDDDNVTDAKAVVTPSKVKEVDDIFSSDGTKVGGSIDKEAFEDLFTDDK